MKSLLIVAVLIAATNSSLAKEPYPLYSNMVLPTSGIVALTYGIVVYSKENSTIPCWGKVIMSATAGIIGSVQIGMIIDPKINESSHFTLWGLAGTSFTILSGISIKKNGLNFSLIPGGLKVSIKPSRL